MADSEKAASSAASSLFDLRTVIAVLFAFYGIVLTIMGIISGSPQDTVKSGGINLNLWTGITMLVLAVLFVVWARMKPLNAGAAPPDAANDRPAHH
jgi:cytochrome b561